MKPLKPHTILITSFHPLITRNILATPLLDQLRSSGVRVVIACRREKQEFFEREFGREGIAFEGLPDGLRLRDMFLRALALAGLDTKTLRLKRAAELNGSGSWFAALAGNGSFARSLVRGMSRRLTPRKDWHEMFGRLRPDVVFVTDVQNERDIQALHEAARRGIRTVGMVRSWDNLTAKGLIRFVPDTLIVHNDIISREAQALHGIPAERIRVVGIPHYDRVRTPLGISREEFFRRIGGDPKKRLVLAAPIGDRYIRRNTVDRAIVRLLDSFLPSDMQILVRLPPGDSVEGSAEFAKPGRIFLDRASRGAFVGAMSRQDDEHLRATLSYSSLVVAGPSTICVDAALFDKPVVLIGFDGDEERPYNKSVRRYYDYDHFRPIVSSGGAALAHNPGELERFLKEYLADPTRDRPGRTRIVREQCGEVDGYACERLTEILLSE